MADEVGCNQVMDELQGDDSDAAVYGPQGFPSIN
jgi:hypothetical protein|tara:strand:+ start:1318 stop:1419 length:102 start_codon:yes stop_codon:yes gene_type:complete